MTILDRPCPACGVRAVLAPVAILPVVAGERNSCCSSIVMVEAAQDRNGDDGRCCGRCPHISYRLGDRLTDALMGPRRVEVRAVRQEHPA